MKLLRGLIKTFIKQSSGMNLTILLGTAILCSISLWVGCGALGKSIGGSVGRFVGSYRGTNDGKEDGRKKGLSAEDTAAVVKTDLVDVGRLQVLTAGIKAKNMHKAGEDYAALYVSEGSAVFTVELDKLNVSYNSSDSSIMVKVPEPQVEFFLDQPKKLAEYQKHKFAGSAEDGVEEYLNTMARSEEEIEESISNYDSLEKQARSAAQKQIEMLVKSIRGDILTVSVSFI